MNLDDVRENIIPTYAAKTSTHSNTLCQSNKAHNCAADADLFRTCVTVRRGATFRIDFDSSIGFLATMFDLLFCYFFS